MGGSGQQVRVPVAACCGIDGLRVGLEEGYLAVNMNLGRWLMCLAGSAWASKRLQLLKHAVGTREETIVLLKRRCRWQWH